MKWEWAGGEGASEWLTHDMEVQCLIEESWASVRNNYLNAINQFLF